MITDARYAEILKDRAEEREACNATPARLDADRTAKPLTRIVSHPRIGDCVGPGIPLRNPEHEDEHGKRTSLTSNRTIIGYCIMTERGTFIAVGASLEPREALIPAVTTGVWPLPEQAHSRRASCGDKFGPLTVCPIYVERPVAKPPRPQCKPPEYNEAHVGLRNCGIPSHVVARADAAANAVLREYGIRDDGSTRLAADREWLRVVDE